MVCFTLVQNVIVATSLETANKKSMIIIVSLLYYKSYCLCYTLLLF